MLVQEVALDDVLEEVLASDELSEDVEVGLGLEGLFEFYDGWVVQDAHKSTLMPV